MPALCVTGINAPPEALLHLFPLFLLNSLNLNSPELPPKQKLKSFPSYTSEIHLSSNHHHHR